MNNLDIIVLTVIVSISFFLFIVLSIREFDKLSKTPDQIGKETNTPTK